MSCLLVWVAFDAPAWAAPAPHRTADRLTLVRQSPWVGPKAPNQDLTMGLAIRSSAPRAALGLSFTVYKPLSTLSAFDETLSGHGLGNVDAQSPSIPLSGFTTDAQGVTAVTIPVDGDTTPTGTGNWTADLRCAPGSCADVYPVKVTLTDSTSSGAGAQLVTYLVYDDPSSTSQSLRVALVIPIGLTPPVADAKGDVPAPGAAAVTELEGLVAGIEQAPSVPITLAPDPATLEHLVASGRSHPVSEIATLSNSAEHQTLSESFVPVDAGALAGAGLGDELTAQVRRATQVLSAPGVAVHATRGTWVAGSALDQAAINRLAPDYDHLVVPQSAVSGPTGPLTETQPFNLSSGSSGSSGSTGTDSSATAMVSDPDLGSRLLAGKGDDASLAAVQLTAEASLIYYEEPNLRGPGGKPAARGVVAVAPTAWAPSQTFVASVLGDLQANPVLEPVTLDQFFAQVAVGADDQPVTRHPVSPSSATSARVAHAVRLARGRQTAFASAVDASAAGVAESQSTNDLLLAAEAGALSPTQQLSALAGFETALGRHLDGLTVRSDTIRLTAGTASVPITLLRNTPYPVTVVVELTSDKLRFPKPAPPAPGAICRAPTLTSSAGRSSFSAVCTLDHDTNAVYVNMQSRASGDFQIDVTLTAPRGNLVMASGTLTVRSLSTSAVAIALSVGAALVLLAWWGRTLWRGKGRRGAHVASRSKESTA